MDAQPATICARQAVSCARLPEKTLIVELDAASNVARIYFNNDTSKILAVEIDTSKDTSS